jgi:dTDP-4-amino-4,6-dideoxygalactose transaminase
VSTKFCNVHIPDMEVVKELLNTYSRKERMSNFGPLCDKLCKELHTYLSVPTHKEVICVSSGHVALMTAFSALNSKRVVVPSYTFCSTSQAASLQGITVEVLDVGPGLPFITAADLDRAKTGGVEFDTVVFVAPLSIVPKELYSVQTWCRLHGVKLVIDGATTFGTPNVYGLGDAYCLSFHATKSFPVGEGGAVVLNRELIPAARSFVCFGMDSSRRVIRPGLNGKISEYTAAVALALLQDIHPYLQKRRENTGHLERLLKGHCTIFDSAEGTVYQCFPIFIANSEKVIRDLKLAEIDVNRYYNPLCDMDGARGFYLTNVCLPCHPDMDLEEITQMVDIVKAAV